MGWEARGGKSYYYRKERDGASVRSVYVGSNETAQLIAQLDALQTDEREGKRALAQIEREQWQEQDAELDALSMIVDQVTAATLIAQGFHQHKRQWRRKRT
jgi:hypothetical protein